VYLKGVALAAYVGGTKKGRKKGNMKVRRKIQV
jgi:hypothetical protein